MNEISSFQMVQFFGTIAFYVISGLTSIILIFLFIKYAIRFYKFVMTNQMKNYKIYTWDNSASAANPPKNRWIDGQLWTPINEFKKKSKSNQKENPVYFSNFRFKEKYIEDVQMPKFLRKKYEAEKFYVKANDLCKTTVGIGGAGSGKTEFINSIMKQNFYSKSVIFGKKFDFENWAYRPGIDYLFQPKLLNSDVHDILGEDIQYIKLYIETVMASSLGKSQDYFSGSAKQKLEKFLQKVKILEKDNNATKTEKYDLFLQFFEEELFRAHTGEQKSEKDVMSTVNASMEPLRLIVYRIKNGARTFTAKDFYSTSTSNKLFLSAIDLSLEGILAATGAVFAKYQLTLPNHWIDKPVAWFIDEYNSWRRIIDEQIDIEMTELGRSKMFAVFKFFQNLPDKEEEIKNIFSNMQYLLIFSVTDPHSLKQLVQLVGKIEYSYKKENVSWNGKNKNISFSEEKMTENAISEYDIKTLQDEGYHHIFYAPKEKILFKGYTPRVKINNRNYINFKEIELTDFYKWKFELENRFEKRLKSNKSAVESVLAS